MAETDANLTQLANVLSTRQRQVLTCAANGFTSRETAAVLRIKPNTVRQHMESTKRRLKARTMAHAVAIAMGAGIIDPMSLPPLEAGDADLHRIPHVMLEGSRMGIGYDPRCPACREHGDWREGIADLRLRN